MAQTSSEGLQQTPLHNLHIELGAKMVPFAGYAMPVQYQQGIIKEHVHTRAQAGLFDVSHMGQLIISGPNAAAELEKLLPTDLEALAINKQVYSLLTNDQGGIRDDLIVTRWAEDRFFLVVNAGCKAQDIAHLSAQLPDTLTIEHLQDRALLALQGPAAKEVVAQLSSDATALTFMTGCETELDGTLCYITRSGYTGEDGFEISVAAADAEPFARKLLSFDQVEAIGLGARDSLRLEAGLCLYSHDLDTTTSPIEAGLKWAISPSRRNGGVKAGGFPGADIILEQIDAGVARKRVGIAIEGRAPVREGAELQDAEGNSVGIVTSGGFGPSIETPVAMGYVNQDHAAPGTQLLALVRGKAKPVSVTRMPFVQQNYQR